ncbi:MAG: hypothetical protein IRZ16_04170, partial [Myxococcaceae bacterium]|nr:hypothetical protein [Myxococcaceae bacterium]
LAVGGGLVGLTFSALTEYDPGVSSRHQYQAYYLFDAATGAPRTYFGSCSHSFQQRLVWDGARFVGLCLGDAGPRGIGVTAVSRQGEATTRIAFAIKGGDDSTGGAYQNTFSRVGAILPGGLGYALLFSTENSPVYDVDNVNAPRDLVFMHIRPDFEKSKPASTYDVAIADTADHNFRATGLEVEIHDYFGGSYTGKNHGLIWLTQFADTSQNAESPKLVRLASGHFIALWEEWTLTAYTATYGMVIDEYGNVQVPRTKLGDMRLSRGDDAFALGDGAAWVVGDATVPALVLYTVDEALTVTRYELR